MRACVCVFPNVADNATHTCPRHSGVTVCSLETSRCLSQLPIFKSLVFPHISSEGSARRGEVNGAPFPSLLDKKAQL